MRLALSASADFELDEEVFLALMVEPRLSSHCHQVVTESLRTTPVRFARLDADLFGNPLRRFVAPRGLFNFDFRATVTVEPPVPVEPSLAAAPLHELPSDLLTFTLPSRYCESDVLRRMAHGEFGMLLSGGGRVQAVMTWIRAHMELVTDAPNATSSAGEAVLRRAGGDRDWAHVMIALCRALDIPARYISGYCLGYDNNDFHCWTEVWLNGRWHAVDPTSERVRFALVPIAVGRDAADVFPVRLHGKGRIREQSIKVTPVTDRDDPGVP